MAIPFYEPRQQHTATDCDQVDGHFPPAPPSSQSMAVPTANLGMPVTITQLPANTSTFSPTAVSNAATATATTSVSLTAPHFPAATTALLTSTSATAATVGAAATTSTATTSSHVVTSLPAGSAPSVATATFSISSTSPAIPTSLPHNSTSSPAANETFASASSSTQPAVVEPLPWKLLAVAMCKALKQYYQQTGSRDVFIEIMPSGVGSAQEQSPAAGN
ncbi:putative protein TPRXL [Rhagoletis pomonella]|uniref:putative protein TPRXL n=1 Tax=Rhagoletis pomonella TaxID=28610 RepID=UPI001785D41F|nr:putative protein TPRXL [Rhagoletis pomonella]